MSRLGQGTIEPGALPGILRDLYVERSTGLLHFTKGADRGSVCFIKGHIAWGQSSLEECRLGAVLVRHGLVAQESIDQAYELVGPGRRLGDVLIDAGVFDRERLDLALALQVRETLLEVFRWSEGEWRFDEHDPAHFKGYDHALRISTGDIIMDAVWCIADPDVVRYALGDLDRPLALTTDPLLRFQRVTLTEMDRILVTQADGIRTAREILELVPDDTHEAQRSLFGLLCVGLLDLVQLSPVTADAEDPVPSREEVLEMHRTLASRDHFEVLGIARSASALDARRAFERLARRFHPDVQALPELAGLGTPIAEVFTRLAEAERVLTVPAKRAEYERRLVLSEVQGLLRVEDVAPSPPPPAPAHDPAAQALLHEEAIVGAERNLAESRYWDALQALDSLLPELHGRQQRRAAILRARALAHNPKWRKDAEDQLKAILAQDPGSVDALFELGLLYKAGGLDSRAAATFRRVLELRPRHSGALAELGS